MPWLAKVASPGLLVRFVSAEDVNQAFHGAWRPLWLLVLSEMPGLVRFSSGVVGEYAKRRQVRRNHRRRDVDDSIVVMVEVLVLREVRELLH